MGILDEEEDRKESAHLTFRCPPSVYERLMRAVKATGWKRSKLIVRLVSFGLDTLERELEAEKKNNKK